MKTNKRLVLSLAVGLAIFGVGMLPALLAAFDKVVAPQSHAVERSNQPHADESASCSPSPSTSPGE